MDDFTISNLNESKNEYSALLIGKITPSVMKGIYSIYNEAVKLCKENDEHEKYLMTFQNFLGRITKWNTDIIETETERIKAESGCEYLEDLLTCVHVNQLKILTCVRVGQKQKKIDIDIPNLSDFIHKIYIDVARKVYKNVYLFEASVNSLTRQKYLRELELLVKESILDVIRSNMPMEKILKSYLDETNEEDVHETVEEIKEEIIEKPIVQDVVSQSQNDIETESSTGLSENVNNVSKVDSETEISIDTNTDSSLSSNTQIGTIKKIDTEGSSTPEPVVESFTSENSGIIKIQDDVKPVSLQHEVTKEMETLSFNNQDSIKNYDTSENVKNIETTQENLIQAPKDVDTLEEISEKNWEMRRNEYEDDEYDSDEEKIQIFDESTPIEIDDLPISNYESSNIKLNTDDDLLGEIETLV